EDEHEPHLARFGQRLVRYRGPGVLDLRAHHMSAVEPLGFVLDEGAALDDLVRAELPGEENRRRWDVVVPDVVVHGLVAPNELTGVGVQRDDGVAPQILARGPGVPRNRIAGADVDSVELRIDRNRIPDGAATVVIEGIAVP